MNINITPSRVTAIDALRGLIMALMLVDHVRENFFFHHQVVDPMALDTTSPALFFTRLSSHFCAPIFVFLTGLGAWLNQQKSGQASTTARFLIQRGLFLIVLEFTVISFAWTFDVLPSMFYFQVIWVIGCSMIALAALLWLPWRAQLALGLLIVGGHNLLDGVHFAADETGHILWALLHDRTVIDITDTIKARTSYPLLPWIGVILLGYAAGPLYRIGQDPAWRQQRLLLQGFAVLAGFVLLRLTNFYGDHPWHATDSLLDTAMSFLNLTKYPPSLLYLMLTLGVGLLVLALLERYPAPTWLETLGRVPMFFYILHLYVLHLLYCLFSRFHGTVPGERYGFSEVWQLWLLAILVLPALYLPCRWFAAFKRLQGGGWTSYL